MIYYDLNSIRVRIVFLFIFFVSGTLHSQVASQDYIFIDKEVSNIQEQLLYDFDLAENNTVALVKKYRPMHIPEFGIKLGMLKVRLFASNGDMVRVKYEMNRLKKIRFLHKFNNVEESKYQLYRLLYVNKQLESLKIKKLSRIFHFNRYLSNYEKILIGCKLHYYYSEKGNNKKAKIFEKAIAKILRKEKKPAFNYYAQSIFGQGHFFQMQVEEARKHFRTAKKIAQKQNWPSAMQYANVNIGETYLYTENLAVAKQYFDTVLHNKSKTELRDLYQVYGCLEYYFQLSDMPDSSYRYLELRNAIDDRLEDEKSGNLVNELDAALNEEINTYKYQSEIKKNQQLKATISIIVVVSIIGSIFLIYFITQIKHTNILLKRQKAHIELNLNLKEKMLKEIHHRIKNNLQIVSSILNLQSKNITDPTALQIIEEGKERIQAIAIVHNQLHLSKDAAYVEMDAYILQFVDQMKNSFIASNKDVQFLIQVEKIQLPIDYAVPLGLILCELLSNSYKHAFTHFETGKIDISLKQRKFNKKLIEMEYADNGSGYHGSQPFLDQTSTGTEIIQAFVQQLDAKFELIESKGFHVKMEFKIL